jgi:vesicle coat complex subunit
VDTKKGEVSELKQLLKTLAVERDPKRKRDVIKKVIAYMTLGIDVSRLFTEMVMAIETRDLVVKKMVYLYLCNYAHAKPDLALMCVNTLQRDCSADDPMVRGLALRALCSLRLPSMLEYISAPLRRALTDQSPYVRKTGVMGILKLFHLAPEVARAANFVDLLYNMIQDPDPHVVANCLIVLDEVLAAEEGGMAVNQPLILHLLGRLGEFSEWGLTVVLALVAKYRPVDEEELFSIMNLLDPVLRTSNSGVVLSTIKCFLHLTNAVPDLQPQVYVRVKAPLLTLMAGGNPEVEYCILKHLEAMVHRAPGVFDDEYRQLYVRYNEPTFVKYEKIGILALIANDDTVGDITSELAEYATDIDQEVSRRSIRAIGNIAFRLPSAAGMVLERLVEFLDIEMNSVRPETILVMKDLLRRYPERKTEVLPSLQRCLRRVDDEPEAQAALIWMAGEYGGEGFPEAPYLLEPLIDGYAGLASAMVKLNLLTATMKLFLKRPPETQSMLGRLLAAATNDLTSQDVHDRALLYYRLLAADVHAARRVVLGEEKEGEREELGRAVVLGAFAEERDMTSLREKLFGEFNTLAVVYGKPSAQFVSPRYVHPFFSPVSYLLLYRYYFFSVFLFPSFSLFSVHLILCLLNNYPSLPPSIPPSLPPLPKLPMQAPRDLPHPLPHGRPRRGERERRQQPLGPERRRQLTA